MQKYNFLKKISEIYHHKNTQLVLSLLCIFIMMRFSFMVLGTIKGVFLYDIYNHFDYEYQKKIVNNNLFTHTLLLYLPIFLSFFAILKRKIGLKEFTLSLILSYLANKYQWFDIVHNVIKNTFIFDYLKSTGRTVINNQYTRIIFYLLFIFILLIQILRKKTRTLSRIMIFFITTSCLFTVTIFHIAIPMGIFKSVLEDKSQIQKYEVEKFTKEEICKVKNCYNISSLGQIEVISEKEKPDNFKQYEWIISKGIYLLNSKNETIFSEPVNVNAGFLFDYDIITLKKENDKYFTVIDNVSIRKFSRESEIMFSFLAIMAHFIWIFGGLVLLEFHYYKFKKRATLKLKKDNL